MLRRRLGRGLPRYLLVIVTLLIVGAGLHFSCAGDVADSTLGQPCSASEPCGPDAVCDQQLGVCVAPRSSDGGSDSIVVDGGAGDGGGDGFLDAATTGAP